MAKMLKFKYVVAFMIAIVLITSISLFSVSYSKWTGGKTQLSASVNVGEWQTYSVILYDNNGNVTTTYEMTPTQEGSTEYSVSFVREEGNEKVNFRVFYKGAAVEAVPTLKDKENLGIYVTQDKNSQSYQTQQQGVYTVYADEKQNGIEIRFELVNDLSEFFKNADGIVINGQPIRYEKIDNWFSGVTVELKQGESFKIYVDGEEYTGKGFWQGEWLENNTNGAITNDGGTFTANKDGTFTIRRGKYGIRVIIEETK